MNHQKENQTSQLPQNNLLTPPVLYRSIANERIYDDDVTLPQVQNSTDHMVFVQKYHVLDMLFLF